MGTNFGPYTLTMVLMMIYLIPFCFQENLVVREI